MAAIDYDDFVLRIAGLGTEKAGYWASRAVTIGATRASISDGQFGLVLTVEFASSGMNGQGTLNLIELLRFAAEVEGHSASDLLAKAEERSAQNG